MKQRDFEALYPALAARGLDRRQMAQELNMHSTMLARHLWKMFGRTLMSQEEFLERYVSMVRRCPDMTNKEMARALSMTHAAFTRRLSRARTAGKLNIYRVGQGGKPELAPPGLTGGYVPAVFPRRRRLKDLEPAA